MAEAEIDPDEDPEFLSILTHSERHVMAPRVIDVIDNKAKVIELLVKAGFEPSTFPQDNQPAVADIPQNRWLEAVRGQRATFLATNPKMKDKDPKLAVKVGHDVYHDHTHTHKICKGVMTFRCAQRKQNPLDLCNANVKVNAQGIVETGTHGHASHVSIRQKEIVYEKLTHIAITNLEWSVEMIHNHLIALPELQNFDLPSMWTAKKAIYNVRRAFIPAAPNNVMDITLTSGLYMNILLFERIITHEDGSQDKIIAIGSQMQLEMLAMSDEISCDGTFASSSKHFYQVYTLHAKISPFQTGKPLEDQKFVREKNALRPAVYIFLTSKKQVVYEAMLEGVKEVVEQRTGKVWDDPKRFLVDFEIAVVNAIEKVSKLNEIKLK